MDAKLVLLENVVKGGAGVDIASSYEINVNQDSKVWLLIRRLEAGRLLKRRGNLMGCAEKTNEQCATMVGPLQEGSIMYYRVYLVVKIVDFDEGI